MLSKEEIEKLLSCNECDFNECRQCEITYTDKKNIREYIEQLEKSDASKEKSSMNYYNEVKELKADKQKLIDKLEYRKFEIECLSSQINGNYFMKQDELDLINEILSIMKGEK